MSSLPRASMYSSLEKLNMEMRNRPDLVARFKHKPYSLDQHNNDRKATKNEKR